METVQSVPSKRRRDRFPATRRTFSIRRLEWTSKTVERCDAFEAPTSLKMTTSEKDVLEELHFFNSPSPILFSFIFGLCKQTNYTILQKMTKCQYSIQCYDLNPIPPEHESPPITTRPGLPPQGLQFFNARGPTHEVLKHFSRVKFADCR